MVLWPDGTPKDPPPNGGKIKNHLGGLSNPDKIRCQEKEPIKVLSDDERKAFANKQRNKESSKIFRHDGL